jgi:ribosomal protein L16 Arg81 hydroxylase
MISQQQSSAVGAAAAAGHTAPAHASGAPAPATTDAAQIGFADLIAPVPLERFLAEHWEKAPLVSRGRRSDVFVSLFSAKDIDRILTVAKPKPSRIEVVTEQGFVRENYLNPDGTANVNLVMERYLAGSTIILSGLDEIWEPLSELARTLEVTLNHQTGMTVYLTPPGVGGVQPHFDTQENFLLQVEGSKHWKIYPPLQELPAVRGSWAAVPRERIGQPIFEATINAGDVLYIPRGFVHEGRASDAPSLHITVDLAVCTWQDFLGSALSALAERDPRYRRSLPVGFLSSGATLDALETEFGRLLDRFRAGVRIQDAITKQAETLLVRRPPLPDGHFAMLFATIDADTPLRKRGSTFNRVFTTGAVAGIQFAGNQLLGPPKILPALHFIEATDIVTAASLPGSLNLNERLVLVRRLVRTGLLRLA